MIIKMTLSCAAVVVGWIAVLAAVMLISDEAPAALVLFPSTDFLAALPPDVSITSQNAFSVTLRSEAGHTGLMLYNAGALLVLPSGLLGCAPLTS